MHNLKKYRYLYITSTSKYIKKYRYRLELQNKEGQKYLFVKDYKFHSFNNAVYQNAYKYMYR